MDPFRKFIESLDKTLKSRGIDYFILYVKDIRGNLMNYLSNNPSRSKLSKTTKEGIPVVLGDLIPLVRDKSYLAIAMIFTILFSTRSLKTGKVPNTQPITDPFTGDLSDIDAYYASF
jgi:hypothetical protein